MTRLLSEAVFSRADQWTGGVSGPRQSAWHPIESKASIGPGSKPLRLRALGPLKTLVLEGPDPQGTHHDPLTLRCAKHRARTGQNIAAVVRSMYVPCRESMGIHGLHAHVDVSLSSQTGANWRKDP